MPSRRLVRDTTRSPRAAEHRAAHVVTEDMGEHIVFTQPQFLCCVRMLAHPWLFAIWQITINSFTGHIWLHFNHTSDVSVHHCDRNTWTAICNGDLLGLANGQHSQHCVNQPIKWHVSSSLFNASCHALPSCLCPYSSVHVVRVHCCCCYRPTTLRQFLHFAHYRLTVNHLFCTKTGSLHDILVDFNVDLAVCETRITAVTATELLQPLDLTCGTLFLSSWATQTSAMDCLDDSWRDIFLANHERSVTSRYVAP